MKDNDVSDRILELLVEGVLDASPEEIARIAAAEGIDEAKLHNAVRKGIMLGFKAELALHQMSDEHSHQLAREVADLVIKWINPHKFPVDPKHKEKWLPEDREDGGYHTVLTVVARMTFMSFAAAARFATAAFMAAPEELQDGVKELLIESYAAGIESVERRRRAAAKARADAKAGRPQ